MTLEKHMKFNYLSVCRYESGPLFFVLFIFKHDDIHDHMWWWNMTVGLIIEQTQNEIEENNLLSHFFLWQQIWIKNMLHVFEKH